MGVEFGVEYDVLVYGPLFCDLIFTRLPGMPVLGEEVFAQDFHVSIGGSAIVAAALRRLGARVGLIADLGNDPTGQWARGLLDEFSIDRRLIREHDHALPQITVALSFPHERAFITRFERPATPPDLVALLRGNPAQHLHVCGFLALQETPDITSIARSAGLTVSLDCGWDEDALRDPRLLDVISQVDVFLPSRNELCCIGGSEDCESVLLQLSAKMPSVMIVMKDGARGVAACLNGVIQRVPAIPVEPVDTTGAGDSFDAGFLYAYIQGLPLTTCLHYGNICGALATTAVGGAVAAPTLEEVQTWLSRLPSSAAAAPTRPD